MQKCDRTFKSVSRIYNKMLEAIYNKMLNAIAMSRTFRAATKYFDQAEKPVLSAYA